MTRIVHWRGRRDAKAYHKQHRRRSKLDDHSECERVKATSEAYVRSTRHYYVRLVGKRKWNHGGCLRFNSSSSSIWVDGISAAADVAVDGRTDHGRAFPIRRTWTCLARTEYVYKPASERDPIPRARALPGKCSRLALLGINPDCEIYYTMRCT